MTDTYVVKIKKYITTVLVFFAKQGIKGYQKYISAFIPARCRYYPTCSQYGLQALSWHGVTKGGLLTIQRVCRCHPLGGHGIDFVPLPLYRFQFVPLAEQRRIEYYVFQCSYHSSYGYHLNKWLHQPL